MAWVGFIIMGLVMTLGAGAALAVVAFFGVLASLFMAVTTAQAATLRNGVCETGEFCYYYNSDFAGSISASTARSAGSSSARRTSRPWRELSPRCSELVPECRSPTSAQ